MVVCEKLTGRALWATNDLSARPPDPDRHEVINAWPSDINNVYAKDGALVLRPEGDAAIPPTMKAGQEVVLPVGPNTQLFISGGDIHAITDGTAELSFDHPGTYTGWLEDFPKRMQTFIIEVTP